MILKKLFIVMVIALLTVSAATAEGFLIPKAKPHMAPGAFAASVGVNFGYGSVGVAGGVETILGQINIPDAFPLTYGVAARGALSTWGSTLYTAAGGFATLHLGWTSFNLPEWVQKFDTYAGIGLGVNITPSMHIGFASLTGLAYHLNDNLAIVAEGLYLGWYGFASSLGVQIKL